MNTPSNYTRYALVAGAALMASLVPGGRANAEATPAQPVMLSPQDHQRALAALEACKSNKLSADLTRFTNELVLEALCADGNDESCLSLEGVDKTVALKATNIPTLSADAVDACLEGRSISVKPKKPKGKGKLDVQSLSIEQTDMKVAKCLHDALNGELPTFTPVLTPKPSFQPNAATPLPGIRVGASTVPTKDIVPIDVRPGYGGSSSTSQQPTSITPVDATGVVSELEKCVSFADKSKKDIGIVKKVRRILEWAFLQRKSVVTTDALDELSKAQAKKRAEQERVLELIQRGTELGAPATRKDAYGGVRVK